MQANSVEAVQLTVSSAGDWIELSSSDGQTLVFEGHCITPEDLLTILKTLNVAVEYRIADQDSF